MPGHRILIVYATTRGQTAKIARSVADRLRAGGDDVTLADAGHVPALVTPRAFDGVVVGSSVTFGRHQRSVERFVTRHGDALLSRPSVFFSVSGAAAGRNPGDLATARGYVDGFVRATGWTPARVELFGGAMAYTKYNPLLRWVIRRIAAKAGAPTDTSRDHEFTDWAAVDRFADAFAASMAPAAAAAEPALA